MTNQIDPNIYEEILESVQNPSSYLGIEQNSIHKNLDSLQARILLAFPDLYKIGMAHMGLKILYHIINKDTRFAAERLFTPADDFMLELQKRKLPLISLETKSFLTSFDIIGFTIPYELSYTNILHMLSLGNIPLRSANRDATFPLIIGGGAGVYNPEPIAPFFDLFLLGDGEHAIIEIAETVANNRDQSKSELLELLSKIDGVYVPSYYDVSYLADNEIEAIKPLNGIKDRVERIWIDDLADSPFPVDMVIPFSEVEQNRISVEIDRGCTGGCRFCQAGITYRPVRERTTTEIEKIIEQTVDHTGIDEVSLMSLSAGDYSQIEPLLKNLSKKYSESAIKLALPSLRPVTLTDKVVESMSHMRRSSFTIAVEAATERLRGTINKKVSNKEVKDVIALLIQNNWCRIKLYFMIGLPTETDFDVEQIGQLAKELAQVEVNNKRLTGITISIGNFVPKAHTPFQWSSFDSIENLKRKQAIILDSVKRMKKINVKFHNVYTSRLEALFARGDRRLSDAIESAFEDGLRFDAWSEKFDRLKWDEVFNRLSIDASFYINRQIAKEATLPWQHLDIMVEHKRLLKEASLAEQDKISMDCRTGSCLACGIDPNHCSDYKKSFNSKVIPYQKEDKIVKGTGLYKYRFTYQKRGLIRFISYIQTTLLFKRAFRQAKLPLAFRQGFARNLKISFDDALPLGYESLNEKFDLSLTENIPVDHLLKLISKSLPENLSVTDIKLLPAGAKSIQVATKSNHYKVVIKELINKEDFVRKINEYNLAPKLVVSRRRKEKIESFDLKESVSELLVDFDSFIITNGRSELSFNYFLNKKSRPKATVSDIVCHLFNRKIRTRVTKLGN